MARITAKNVIFCATARSCTPAPPTRSVPNAAALGGLNISLRSTSLRLTSNVVYKPAEKISEIDVAIAAPATPIALNVPTPKMKSGSRTTFNI